MGTSPGSLSLSHQAGPGSQAEAPGAGGGVRVGGQVHGQLTLVDFGPPGALSCGVYDQALHWASRAVREQIRVTNNLYPFLLPLYHDLIFKNLKNKDKHKRKNY